jgi:GTP-binding protein
MMEKYLENRQGLKVVAQLVDVRHAPSKQDLQMYDYLKYYGLDGLVILTKADKVSRNELNKNTAMIRKALDLKPEDRTIAVSALKKTGCDVLLTEFDRIIEGNR